MGYPVWTTAPGSLGKIAELEFWNYGLQAHDPETILNVNASPESLGRAEGVTSTWTIKDGKVLFEGTGLPYHGFLNGHSPYNPVAQNYYLTWTCRAGTRKAADPAALNYGMIGMWLNGVAMYNPALSRESPDGFPATPLGLHCNASYSTAQQLNYDFLEDAAGGRADSAGVYHYYDGSFFDAWSTGNGSNYSSSYSSGLAEVSVIPYLHGGLYHPDGHSKILGFSFDGYPVYGTRGYVESSKIYSGTSRMRSGYALKNSSWRQGTGAEDLVQWPMGIFVEDYEYTGAGDLDEHNGRWCVTPDYPDGTYAYFCTIDSLNRPVFPYVIGPTYYQQPTRFPLPGQAGIPTPVNGGGKPPVTNVTTSSNVNFKLIAGRLPPGIQLDPLGAVSGQPVNDTVYVGGVPAAVAKDIDYTFTVRAYSTANTNNISDRTFSLTVTGNNPPELLTGEGYPPPVDLGKYLDGTIVDIQLEAIDLDSPSLTWSIIEGSLPPGVTLNKNTGQIYGVAYPFVNLPEGATTGYDKSRWELYPWEFTTRSVNKNYTFTVEVSDGKFQDTKKYILYIYSHNAIRTDNDAITVDALLFTSDMDQMRPPVLATTDLGDFAVFKADNYFAFKFDVIGSQNPNGYSTDLDGDAVKFSLVAGEGLGFDATGTYFDMDLFDRGSLSLPAGIIMQEDTGWLIGYVPAQITPSIEYTFGVQVYKRDNPTYISKFKQFKLTILGNLDRDISWLTDTNIGYIQAGEISKISIEATSASGQSLIYSLSNNSRLPQGLKLLNDGTLSGRCSFQSFSMDKGTTTFDIELSQKGFVSSPTVFDKTYTFTVVATNSAGTASTEKTFRLQVNIATPEPYENLYVKCLPDSNSRSKITDIVNDRNIFPNNVVYRPNDPFFGRQQNITMLSSYGLTASSAADYIAAMESRHYDKRYYFGNYGVSVARDDNDNILYEVIWVDIIEDTRAYVKGIKQGPPATSIDMRSKIPGWNNPTDPNEYLLRVNDQQLMSRDVSDALGRTNATALPDWMSSLQKDGTVTGYVTRAPLVYIKAGYGDEVLFRLNRSSANGTIWDLTEISFVADRYILDNNLSQYFDTVTNQFEEHHYTTFDTIAKLPTSFTPVATVDFATEIPFNYINGRSVAQLEALGGLDSIITSYEGKTLVFAKQENYTGFDQVNPANDGWERYLTFYGDQIEGYDSVSYDHSEVIPGYVDHGNTNIVLTNVEITDTSGTFSCDLLDPDSLQQGQSVIISGTLTGTGTITGYSDPAIYYIATTDGQSVFRLAATYEDAMSVTNLITTSIGTTTGLSFTVKIPNLRAGIWKIEIDTRGLINLVFQTELDLEQVIQIRYGSKYGGNKIWYSVSNIIAPMTVPDWKIIQPAVVNPPAPTTFDSNTTRFLNAVDTYQAPEIGDKYLKFPKIGVFS